MTSLQGHFVWFELMTTDVVSAITFYQAAVGWRAADAGMPGHPYTILSAGDVPVGGIAALPPAACDAGARAGWIGYIGVDDVDAFVARISEARGGIDRAAEDIPGVGRFAIVRDPQGAGFTLFTPLGGAAAPPAPGATPGRVGWCELHATEWESAFAFYSSLFGWTKTQAIDMGTMGIYQTFATGGPTGTAMAGGMMTKTDAFPVPAWIYYFNVDDTGAAVSRITDMGGQLLNGPIQVPGGSWVAQCLDPQGVVFAVVGSYAGE